jgi:hypothetical protein
MVTCQLSSIGVSFDDEVRDLLIFCSFPKRWNGFFMVVNDFVSSSNTLNFDDVVGAILSREMQRKSIGETSGNDLTAKNRGRQRERGNILGTCGNYKGVYKSIGKLECWHCRNKGHMKKKMLVSERKTRIWTPRG